MNHLEYNRSYRLLIEELKNNAMVFGAILTGSRARGLSYQTSDTDLYIIVSDKMDAVGINHFKHSLWSRYAESISIDLSLNSVQRLANFRTYAHAGTENAWDRYALVHAVLEFENLGGELADILESKQLLTDAEKSTEVAGSFPAYLNYAYRSVHSLHHQNKLAAVLDAAHSVHYLVTMIFSLHNRVRPFNKFLEWELTNYPIPGIDFNEFLRQLKHISGEACLADQRDCFCLITEMAREQGFGQCIDDWGEKLRILQKPA